SIETVAAKFDAGGLQRLLVVDSGKILCGIIARSDLAWYFPERVGGRFVSATVPPLREMGSDSAETTTITPSGSSTRQTGTERRGLHRTDPARPASNPETTSS